MSTEVAQAQGGLGSSAGAGVLPAARVSPLPRGPLSWQVFALALPMLGEQVLMFLVGLVDTFLAGQISKEATAAVGTASYMGWFVSLAFSLVGVGAAALVSRAVGAGQGELANRTLNQSMILAGLVGLGTAIGAWMLAPAMAGFLTRTPEAYQPCLTFLRIVAPCYFFASLNLVGGAVLRAAGDTRTPLGVMSLVNGVNVVISAGLVFGWFGVRLGVAGIALGTLGARTVGGLLMVGVLSRGLHGLRVRLGGLRPEWATIVRVLRIGLPTAGEMGLMSIAQMAFIKIIAHTAEGPQATANYAAHIIAMEVEAISYLPAVAWGTAAATLIGQNLGASRPLRAARAGHTAALQGLLLSSLTGAGLLASAGMVYEWMSDDPLVRSVGTPAMRLLAFAQPFLVMGIIYMSALRGAGDTRVPMAISLVCGLALRVPLAWIGGIVLGGGLIGAWCGMWADNVSRFLLALARFQRGGWRHVRV